MEGQIVQVDFQCEACKGIITLGIVGGIESLNGDMPPSCLYCSAIGTLKHVILNRKWTVYVGGVEVNDHLLTLDEAVSLQSSYLEQSYDDVKIMEVEE